MQRPIINFLLINNFDTHLNDKKKCIDFISKIYCTKGKVKYSVTNLILLNKMAVCEIFQFITISCSR